MSLKQIELEIGRWSRDNFGGQPSSNPLLGMCEELGELFDATDSADEIDACADIGIYLCDFCCREGFRLSVAVTKYEQQTTMDPRTALVSSIAKIQRIYLKRQQKIRGYANALKYRDDITFEMSRLWTYLDRFLWNNHGVHIDDQVEKTFDSIVSHRNWKLDQDNG